MKKRKIKKRYHKSKNALVIVALVVAGAIITASLSSLFDRVYAKEKITITEFRVLTKNSGAKDITSGSDGNIWFTEDQANKIGQVTPNGKITEFPIPANDSVIGGITAGPDGNIWFAAGGNKVGRLTPDGTVTDFTLPGVNDIPKIITAGPDGNLWVTIAGSENSIGRITLSGTLTKFPIPTTGSDPAHITAGHDGNLWFTEYVANKIGRITIDGIITEFSVPTSDSYLGPITSGPDGNIWFTEFSGKKIGKITPGGIITEFVVPTSVAFDGPFGITAGPDGNLWFTKPVSNKIGRITTDGLITEFLVPTNDSTPNAITAGLDGNIWFTENSSGKIGRVNLADQNGHDRDFALLSPFNNGVTWTVSSGYFNNRNQTSTGCHIGTGPDHCRNQLFGLDLVPDQQSDTDILAPGNGKVEFIGKLEDEDCIGMRITLDNGLNLNVCHFASFNVNKGERIIRGKVLGIRSSPHVHLSLDDRYRIGTLCPGKERCFLPVPFDGQHTIEGVSFDPNPNGETVLLPYPLCDQRKVDCKFEVDFQQYKGLKGISSNIAIP